MIRAAIAATVAAGLAALCLGDVLPKLAIGPLTPDAPVSFEQTVKALAAKANKPDQANGGRFAKEARAFAIYSDHAKFSLDRVSDIFVTLDDQAMASETGLPSALISERAITGGAELAAFGQADCERLKTALASRCLILGSQLAPVPGRNHHRLHLSFAFQESADIGPHPSRDPSEFSLVKHGFETTGDSIADINAAFYRDAEATCAAIRAATGNCSLVEMTLSIDTDATSHLRGKGTVLLGKVYSEG